MTQGSYITDEMRSWIGRELGVSVHEMVTKRDIHRLAQANANYDPLHLDEEYAKKTRYGGIIAPRLFFGIGGDDADEPDLQPDGLPSGGGVTVPRPPGLPRRMAGGADYEFFLPVRPGDVITATTRMADFFERTGRTGPLVFGVTEITYTNQRGEVVAICRTTIIDR